MVLLLGRVGMSLHEDERLAVDRGWASARGAARAGSPAMSSGRLREDSSSLGEIPPETSGRSFFSMSFMGSPGVSVAAEWRGARRPGRCRARVSRVRLRVAPRSRGRRTSRRRGSARRARGRWPRRARRPAAVRRRRRGLPGRSGSFMGLSCGGRSPQGGTGSEPMVGSADADAPARIAATKIAISRPPARRRPRPAIARGRGPSMRGEEPPRRLHEPRDVPRAPSTPPRPRGGRSSPAGSTRPS